MQLRGAGPEDAPGIVRLVNEVFGLDRTTDWFNHYHFLNPAGPSLLMVAVNEDDEIVSCRSLARVVGHYHEKRLDCGQMADTCTHPAYRNQGLATRLGALVIQSFFEEGGDLVFSFPGPQAYPIYMRRLGFTDVGRLRQSVRPLLARGSRGGRGAPDLPGRRRGGVEVRPLTPDLLRTLELPDPTPEDGRLAFDRGPATLEWRTGMPGRRYHCAVLDRANYVVSGEMSRRGLTACTIVEARTSEARNLGPLLAGLAHWAGGQGFAALYTWLPRRRRARYLGSGFLPAPRTTKVVARFRPGLPVNGLRRVAGWRLTLLDTDAY